MVEGRRGNHTIGDELEARVFIADAVVDHPLPLRLYEAMGGMLFAADERVSTPNAIGAFAPI